MKLIVSTFLVYKVKKCLQKSGKVKATFNTDKLKALGWKPLFDVELGFEHTLAECSAGSHPSSK